MRNFIKLVFVFLFATVSLNANTQLNIKAQEKLKGQFLSKFDSLVKIVKKDDCTQDEKFDKIITLLEPMFDFELMAKLSLGKKWLTLSDEDKKEFVKLYVNRMKNSYASKIESYNDEKVVISDIKSPKSNRIVMYSFIYSGDKKIDIDYKFYSPRKIPEGKNDWLIYDVEILGISMLKTDKSQFSEFLRSKSIKQLMESMR